MPEPSAQPEYTLEDRVEDAIIAVDSTLYESNEAWQFLVALNKYLTKCLKAGKLSARKQALLERITPTIRKHALTHGVRVDESMLWHENREELGHSDYEPEEREDD